MAKRHSLQKVLIIGKAFCLNEIDGYLFTGLIQRKSNYEIISRINYQIFHKIKKGGWKCFSKFQFKHQYETSTRNQDKIKKT